MPVFTPYITIKALINYHSFFNPFLIHFQSYWVVNTGGLEMDWKWSKIWPEISLCVGRSIGTRQGKKVRMLCLCFKTWTDVCGLLGKANNNASSQMLIFSIRNFCATTPPYAVYVLLKVLAIFLLVMNTTVEPLFYIDRCIV